MTSEPENSGATDADCRKQPATGPVLDMRDVNDAELAQDTQPTSSPAIESALVGDDAGLPAASRKSDDDTAPAESPLTDDLTDEAPSNVPPVGNAVPPVAITPLTDRSRRGGFVPLFLGGVVAAGLGAGAAWWAIPRMDHGPDGEALSAQLQATADSVRQDAIAAATKAARAEIETQAQTLETRSAKAAQDSATAAADAALKAAGAGLADQGTALTAQATKAATDAATQAGAAAGADAARKLIAEAPADQTDAGLQATLAAQASQLRALDGAVTVLQNNTATSDLKTRLDDLAAQVTDLAARPQVDPAQIQRVQALAEGAQQAQAHIDAAAKDAAAQLTTVREQVSQTQAAADEATRKALTAAAAATLAASLDRSVSTPDRSAALADLQQAGVETPTALAAPVVPLDELQAQFDDASRAGLNAALRSGSSGGGFFNFLRVQTGARSVAPRAGDDPDAVLSRAGDAVARGDISAALSEIATLPEPAQQAMADWTVKAHAWADARSAVSGLTAPTASAPSDSPADTPAAAPAPQTESASAPAAPTN